MRAVVDVFPEPVGPTKRHGFPGLNPKAHILKDRLVREVAERDIPELNRAVDLLQFYRVVPVLYVHRHVEHLEDSLARCHCPLHGGVVHGQRADRIEEPLHIEHERHHDTDLEGVVEDKTPADDHHDGHGRSGECVDHRQEGLSVEGCAVLALERFRRLLIEHVEVDALADHALHDLDAIDVLVQSAVDLRSQFSRSQERALGPRQPDHAHEEQGGHDDQRETAQHRIEVQEQANDPEQDDHVSDSEDRGLKELLERCHVTLQARHQPPDLRLVHEGHGYPLQVQVHCPAHVEQNTHGQADNDDLLQEVTDVVEHHRAEQGGHYDAQQLPVSGALQAPVNRKFDEQRKREGRRAEHKDRRDGHGNQLLVWRHVRDEPQYDLTVEGLSEDLFGSLTRPRRG